MSKPVFYLLSFLNKYIKIKESSFSFFFFLKEKKTSEKRLSLKTRLQLDFNSLYVLAKLFILFLLYKIRFTNK